MTLTEQIWFLVGIGGFLIFLEGAITRITRLIAIIIKRNVQEDYIKMIVGVIIWLLAIYSLVTRPTGS
jgi:lantibiotic modifying enzyme